MELVLEWPGCNFGEGTQTTGGVGREPLKERERGEEERERERGEEERERERCR